MNKINQAAIFIISLIVVQICFFYVQISYEKSILLSLQAILNQESIASNPYSITQSIENLESIGLIRCSKLKNSLTRIVYVETSFKGQCETNFYKLNGRTISAEIKAINGDVWLVNTISNNSSEFYIFLWIVRFLAGSLAISIYQIFQWRISLLLEKKNFELSKKENELLTSKKMALVAAQVSHDIRSPLEALRMIIEGVDNLPIENIGMINMSIKRINDIANDLLSYNRVKTNILSDENIVKLIERLVSEKIIENQNKGIVISFKSYCSDDIMVKLDIVEFGRAFSNLMNNSIESLLNEGKIEIIVSDHESDVLVQIKDNGIGMSEEIISKIGNIGFSYGKKEMKSGSGLGTFHAMETFNQMGGKLKYQSTPNVGTDTQIYLPKSLLKKNELIQCFDYVYIEDDELLRLTWDSKAKKKNIKLLTIDSTAKFDSYRSQISKEHTFIYIDNHLNPNDIKGEDFCKILNEEGFKKIYIASGDDPSKFQHLGWLNCTGKKCPF